MSSTEFPPEPAPTSSTSGKTPIVIIFIGMAGSGKTSLVHAFSKYLKHNKKKGYIINLDPAVGSLPYKVKIDIRDTINYEDTMKQLKLGPNGAILTCLNLYTIQFEEVLEHIRSHNDLDYILIDTPGQIEAFTWSASGQIITDLLASVYPTFIAYVIDTPRSKQPATFMSNMLYACSVMYKTRLPLVAVLNKIDIHPETEIQKWITDFDAFSDALASQETLMENLTRSMSLVLEEFYSTLSYAAASAHTGAGLDLFESKAQEAAVEYTNEYLPHLRQQQARREEQRKQQAEKEMAKLQKDMEADGVGANKTRTPPQPTHEGTIFPEKEAVDPDEGVLEEEMNVQYVGVRTRPPIPSAKPFVES